MRHRAGTLFSVVSLLLCAATCALWARSHWMAYGVVRGTAADRAVLSAEAGHLGYTTIQIHDPFAPIALPTVSPEWEFVRQPPDPNSPADYRSDDWTAKLGFGSGALTNSLDRPPARVMHIKLYWCHFWIPATFFALPAALPLSAAWLRRRVRQWRHRSPTLCPTCGYDLRATPDRCPEWRNSEARSGHARPQTALIFGFFDLWVFA